MNTLAKAQRTPGPLQRSAIEPMLVLKSRRESQVRLETVLVSEDDSCGWNAQTCRGEGRPFPDTGMDEGLPVAC